MELFSNYFHKTLMSKPSVINSWNRTSYPKSENPKLMKTNNGLERYNRELGDIFGHLIQSLIGFIEILRRNQELKLKILNIFVNDWLLIEKERDNIM